MSESEVYHITTGNQRSHLWTEEGQSCCWWNGAEAQRATGCGHRAACASLSVLRNDEGATFNFTATSGSQGAPAPLHRQPPRTASLWANSWKICHFCVNWSYRICVLQQLFTVIWGRNMCLNVFMLQKMKNKFCCTHRQLQVHSKK